MKFFILSGGEFSSSRTNYYMKWLTQELQNKGNVVSFRNSYDDILNKDVVGLKKFFEEEILNSDVVIFCSPVYLHNISGLMKKILDLFVVWSHSLRLAGKVGVVITVSSSNGNKEVSKYLDKILNYFGVTVLGNFSFNHAMPEENIKNELINFMDLIEDTDLSKVRVSERQNKIFLLYKDWYSKNINLSEKEKMLLEEVGVQEAENFQDIFNKNLHI
ncbi:hypothetical protein Si135_01102 [Streptococcus infantarius subsp. infantarius]|nr:hypothetical protein [Streptococcus infantarius subsp. infantarius]